MKHEISTPTVFVAFSLFLWLLTSSVCPALSLFLSPPRHFLLDAASLKCWRRSSHSKMVSPPCFAVCYYLQYLWIKGISMNQRFVIIEYVLWCTNIYNTHSGVLRSDNVICYRSFLYLCSRAMLLLKLSRFSTETFASNILWFHYIIPPSYWCSAPASKIVCVWLFAFPNYSSISPAMCVCLCVCWMQQ